jgi:hypothetical protein
MFGPSLDPMFILKNLTSYYFVPAKKAIPIDALWGVDNFEKIIHVSNLNTKNVEKVETKKDCAQASKEKEHSVTSKLNCQFHFYICKFVIDCHVSAYFQLHVTFRLKAMDPS